MTDQTPEACYSPQSAGRGPAHGVVPQSCLAHKSRWPKDRWLCDKMMADLALAAAVRGLDDAEDVTIIEYDPSITDYPWTVDIGRRHSDAATLTAAIEEALAAKEADRE